MLALAPGWELDVQRGPDWLLVRVVGADRDASDSPPLADRLWELLNQHFTYRLVLELDEIRVLNSYLIGQLVSLYRRIREHEGVMRLCGLSPYNRRVLQICHLDDRFLSYRDRREAVLACHARRRPR